MRRLKNAKDVRLPSLSLLLLATLGVSLATILDSSPRARLDRSSSASLLETALGDGRKLFANHFFTKADVYFHNGYYPTIYDHAEDFHREHSALTGEVEAPGPGQAGSPAPGSSASEHAGHAEHQEHEEKENFLGAPKDWLDAFSRHFYPSHHTHLGEDDESGHEAAEHGRGHGGSAGEEREILPWLRVSAELDPQRVETYVVASYWLRGKLGKVDEAEHFLREGLQANPGDPEILFELGRIYYENRHDPARARNVWEFGLRRWKERQAGAQSEADPALGAGLLNQMALLEREQHNYPKAIEHYRALLAISPNKASIQDWIDYLKTNGPPIHLGHP